ncbi:MAG: HEAT repeat domain-containing protein [Cyanobacteria bacterium J06634_6]
MTNDFQLGQCSPEKIVEHLKAISVLEPRLVAASSRDTESPEFAEIESALDRAFEPLFVCKSSAVPALIELLSPERHAQVRYRAAGTLGSIGMQAVPNLLEVLPSKQTQREVIYALGQVSPTNEEILKHLKVLAADNTVDMNVRWIAAASLNKNRVDMESFFQTHGLPIPFDESIKCLDANEDWERPLSDGQPRKIYVYDLYFQACRLSATISPDRSGPRELYEEVVDKVRELTGKD